MVRKDLKGKTGCNKGYTTIDKLKEVEKPGKLANDLNGFKKKNKLDLPELSPEVVGERIGN